MSEFYAVTQRLQELIPSSFVKLEAHDPAEDESADLLWMTINSDPADLFEGEVIQVSHYGNQWFADYDQAHKVGGWPTMWSISGSADEVVTAVIEYLTKGKYESNDRN